MKRTDIIFLLASIVILSIAWVTFSVIHASTSSTIATDINQEIVPIDATFDTKTISNIQSRLVVTPDYSLQTVSVTSAPSAPTASNSASNPVISMGNNSVAIPTQIPTVSIGFNPTTTPTQGGISP